MAQSIELIIKTTIPQEFVEGDISSLRERGSNKMVESSSLVMAIEKASVLADQLARVCTELKPVREQHLNLLQEISQMLTTVPVSYPRFFFQRLQNSSITLHVSPQPRSHNESVTVQTSEFLGIKVEGVIISSRKTACFRSVQTVTLKLSSQLQNRPAHTLDLKTETSETMSQMVQAHNDFFSTQFLLGFPLPGIYQVTIEASITDTEDNSWKTGPSVTLSVKALEAGPARQQQINTFNSSPQVVSQSATFSGKPSTIPNDNYSATTSHQSANNIVPPRPLV